MAKIENSFARNLYGDGYEKIITMDDGRQYTVKNSFARNLYGDGYEKIITMDDGRQYTVKNSFARNLYGDGYEQVIIEKDNHHNHEVTCNLSSEMMTRILDYQLRDVPPLPKCKPLWLTFTLFIILFIIPIFVGVVSVCLLFTAPTVTQLWWAVIISVIMIIIGIVYTNAGK